LIEGSEMEHEIKGFYGKYRVTKHGESDPLDGPCFVLRYDRDLHAYRALQAYADSAREEIPHLGTGTWTRNCDDGVQPMKRFRGPINQSRKEMTHRKVFIDTIWERKGGDMIVRMLWMQRKERYEGEHAPELLVAVDEYTDDENPDFFAEQCDKALKAVGDEVASYRIFRVELDGEEIHRGLTETALEAKSVTPE